MADRRSHGPEDRYPPLPAPSVGRISVRILALEPGRLDDDIVCRLQVTSIPDSRNRRNVIPYDALSYAFGPDHPTYSVGVDAWNVLIRENLWLALHQIRHPSEQRFLWIDSLCINLHDAAERAAQVQLMDKIYSGARRVLVWLGSGDDDSATAMRIVKYSTRLSSESIETSTSDRQALINWARRPYWNRTWVVQEFLLAREIIFYCGTDSLDWYMMESFLRRIDKENAHSLANERNQWSLFLNTPGVRLMQQRCKNDNHKAPLRKLLIKNRETECYDPRDKVYAMLGLATDVGIGTNIEVSYKIDTRLLLFEVIRHFNIGAKDIPRWTRFLMDILQIDRTRMQRGMGSERQQKLLQEHSLTISGFVTGKILRCGRISEILQPNFSPPYGLTADEQMRLEEVVKQLDRADVERLKRSASDIRRSGSFLSSLPNESSETGQQLYWAVVILSGCTRRRIVDAVSCGTIEQGSNVVQFIGNDIALVMDGTSQSEKIYGSLMMPRFVSSVSDDETRDMETQHICRCQTLQSEADCVERVARVRLKMQPNEILALAQ